MHVTLRTISAIVAGLGAASLLAACQPKAADDLFPVLASSSRANEARARRDTTKQADLEASPQRGDDVSLREATAAMTRAFMKAAMTLDAARIAAGDTIVVLSTYTVGQTSAAGDSVNTQFPFRFAGYLVASDATNGAKRKFMANRGTGTLSYTARRVGETWQATSRTHQLMYLSVALNERHDALTMSPSDWRVIESAGRPTQ